MRVEITDLSSCKKELFIEVPADVVSQKFKAVSTTISQNADIPGFRRGRAPLSVVKTRFRKEIRDQVIRDLLPDALQNAALDNDLAIVGEPNIDDLKLDDGKPFSFKAKIEILPDIEIKRYKGLSLTKKIRIVTDEMVDKRVDEMREHHATLTPVEDREAQDKDFVNLNVRGKYLNESSDDIALEDQSFEIGSSEVQEEFSNNVRGMKLGEERTFRVSYEGNHQNEKLAGKEIEYTVKLESIKIKELPELDDEFAQGLGEYESFEDLKKKVREQFETAAMREADERVREEAVKVMVDENDFEVPDALIERQLVDRMDNLRRMFMQNGIDPRTLDFDWGRMLDSQRKGAGRDVRAALMIEQIASNENVEVSEQDLDEEFTRMGARFGLSADAIKTRLTKDDAIDSIKNRLRNRKAIDFVISNAEIIEERVSAEELDRHDHDHEHDDEHDHEHDHGHSHEHHHDHEHEHHDHEARDEAESQQSSSEGGE